ncbi:hypothetical protein BDL97_09G078900 [Sphagnum fallax]|jgi:nucleoid-associated protein YgaU|uniref:LysM domain-containing protein n=1 Tax=Sphagnum jensenii TaxID=128206 RepID=A0ABP0XNE9_9BRYO|nr:hypothetical protein BDL97_09G078900 [Sphagnum fallax]KAH8952324.1 hypothetical protein BDL97_09G078900 [Sphagnum fallax]
MGQQGSKESSEQRASSGKVVVGTTVKAVQGATAAAKDAAGNVKEVVGAVGAEEREAIRLQKHENWGRVEEGDTLWSLSEKHLGDPLLWPSLHSACRRELGSDPLLLLPGTHVTKACIARAQAEQHQG